MDFGFGAFLEKFEQNFGRTALRCILILMAAAAVAFCLRLIVVTVAPVFHLVRSGTLGPPEQLWDTTINLLLLVFLLAGLSTERRISRMSRGAESFLDQAMLFEAYLEHVPSSVTGPKLLSRVNEMSVANALLAIANLERKGKISPEEAERLRTYVGDLEGY